MRKDKVQRSKGPEVKKKAERAASQGERKSPAWDEDPEGWPSLEEAKQWKQAPPDERRCHPMCPGIPRIAENKEVQKLFLEWGCIQTGALPGQRTEHKQNQEKKERATEKKEKAPKKEAEARKDTLPREPLIHDEEDLDEERAALHALEQYFTKWNEKMDKI